MVGIVMVLLTLISFKLPPNKVGLVINIVLFIFNAFLPDMVPFIDEFLMILAILQKLNKKTGILDNKSKKENSENTKTKNLKFEWK